MRTFDRSEKIHHGEHGVHGDEHGESVEKRFERKNVGETGRSPEVHDCTKSIFSP
jgi:hypothetical protein